MRHSADSETEAVCCPAELAIRITGGKWKMLGLRSGINGAQRYNALLRGVPNISAKELTRNLGELELAGLVTRTKCGDERGNVDCYALTVLGENLRPVFKELGAFGEKVVWEQGAGGLRL